MTRPRNVLYAVPKQRPWFWGVAWFWARWLLIIPTAVLGAVAAQLLVILSAVFSFLLPNVVFRIEGSYLLPMMFVLSGAAMAPRFRVEVGGLLLVMAVLLEGILLSHLLSGKYNTSSSFELTIEILVGVVGAVSALYQIYGEERDQLLA